MMVRYNGEHVGDMTRWTERDRLTGKLRVEVRFAEDPNPPGVGDEGLCDPDLLEALDESASAYLAELRLKGEPS